MKRMTIPIVLLVAALALVAILAIPAAAAVNGYSYNGNCNANAPVNFQASFNKKTPNLPPAVADFSFPGNKIPYSGFSGNKCPNGPGLMTSNTFGNKFPNNDVIGVTSAPKPEQLTNGNGNAKPLVNSGNGNANCNANANSNSLGKKKVKPTVTVIGNKIPKNGGSIL